MDHVSELRPSSVSVAQFVAYWLVVEPPWIELPFLRPFVGKHSFLRREYLDAHPAHLSNGLALFFNILVGPPEEFYDAALLSVLIVVALLDFGCIPDEVNIFERYLFVNVACISHHNLHRFFLGCIHCERIRGVEYFAPIEAVLQC